MGKKQEKNTCFVKILVQEEMVALEKQLEASQRFLGGVRSLASYEDIQQKQQRRLLIALGKSKDLSTSQAASFAEAIGSRLWSEAAVEELQRQVAAKTSQVEVDSGRGRMQDFSQIIHFLTQDLATMILEGKAPADTVLRALCLHAGRMSLRVPSEQTIATFVTLANWQLFCHGMTEKGEIYVVAAAEAICAKMFGCFGRCDQSTVCIATGFWTATCASSSSCLWREFASEYGRERCGHDAGSKDDAYAGD